MPRLVAIYRDGFAEESGRNYLTNRRGDVVAVAGDDFGSSPSVPGTHRVRENIRYLPYGEARVIVPEDFNRDGVVNASDLTAFNAAFAGPANVDYPLTDFNQDGTINVDDQSDYITAYYGFSATIGKLATGEYKAAKLSAGQVPLQAVAKPSCFGAERSLR